MLGYAQDAKLGRFISALIGGLAGAAAKLGLKRTTLICKMQKLGIYRPVLDGSSDPREPAGQVPAPVPQLQ